MILKKIGMITISPGPFYGGKDIERTLKLMERG